MQMQCGHAMHVRTYLRTVVVTLGRKTCVKQRARVSMLKTANFTLGRQMTAARPGSTRAWRKLRDAVIADEPLCWLALPGVCTVRSTTGDHVIPRELGGTDQRSNVRGACRPCNIARGVTPVSGLPALRAMLAERVKNSTDNRRSGLLWDRSEHNAGDGNAIRAQETSHRRRSEGTFFDPGNAGSWSLRESPRITAGQEPIWCLGA